MANILVRHTRDVGSSPTTRSNGHSYNGSAPVSETGGKSSILLWPAKILFLVLMLNVLGFTQDEEMLFQEKPLVPPVEELKLMRREKLQAVMGSVLLERYLRPFDDWVKRGKFAGDNVWNNGQEYDSENWFVLLIRDELEEPIWVKFNVHRVFDKSDLGPLQGNDIINSLAGRIKEGLKASLQQNFILHLDNEDVRRSMIYGEAHIYHLITRDSDVTKLRKEDLIY